MRVERWQIVGGFTKLVIYAQSKADDKAFDEFMNKKLIAVEITSKVVKYADTEKESK